jgi:FkbM family methyltransferase
MSPTAIQKITQLIGTPARDCVYDILGHLDPGLCVDVGAAAGEATRRIHAAGKSRTRVIAFEPFPGNHRFFYESTMGLENVELVRKAVTDRVGRAAFIVPGVVQGTEKGWEKHAGYSSVGFLSSSTNGGNGRAHRSLQWVRRQILRRAFRRPPPQTLAVDTTSIDAEFAGEKIDFMKVDVQGGEAEVLKGADSMLSAGRINVLYIEWSGDPRVIESLSRHNYWICDSTYVAGHKVASRARADLERFEEIGFQILDELRLSTGEVAYELILTREGVSPVDAMAKAKAHGLSWIQTDLIAVSAEGTGRFIEAARRYSESHSSLSINADL